VGLEKNYVKKYLHEKYFLCLVSSVNRFMDDIVALQRWALPIEFRYSDILIAIGLRKNIGKMGWSYRSKTIGLAT
jgi:hypothetical protein